MVNDAPDENPMWVALATLAPDAASSDLVCRIAIPFASMRALIGDEVPTGDVARFPTWDAPHTLLADDEDLARRLRDLDIPVPRPVSAYAVRQDDEREALNGALHRFHDHDERPWGMTAFDPRVGIVVVRGASRSHALLDQLLREVVQSGIVVDARDPHDLRVFALDVLECGRCILVQSDDTRDLRGDEVARAVATLCA